MVILVERRQASGFRFVGATQVDWKDVILAGRVCGKGPPLPSPTPRRRVKFNGGIAVERDKLPIGIIVQL